MNEPHPLQGAALEWYWHQGATLNYNWCDDDDRESLIPEHLLAATFIFNILFHKSLPFFSVGTRIFKSMTLYDESNIRTKPQSFQVELVDTPYFQPGTLERESRIKELADNQLVYLRHYRDKWMSKVIMSINTEDVFGPLDMDLVDKRPDLKLANNFAFYVARFEKYQDYDIQPQHFTRAYFSLALKEMKILDQMLDIDSRISMIIHEIKNHTYVDRWFLELCRECFQGILDHLASMTMSLKYGSFHARMKNYLSTVERKLEYC